MNAKFLRSCKREPVWIAALRRTCCAAFALVVATAALPCVAATYTVTTTSNSGPGSLRQAILDANASGAPSGTVGTANIINVTTSGTISLLDALPLVFSNLTINGNGLTIDGGSAHRCLFVNGLPATPAGTPQTIVVNLNQLHLNHCRAKGGDGGVGAADGGGGGMGAGGALFIGQNAGVTLAQVSFDGNLSVGGNGGVAGTLLGYGGGGGGLGGSGANGTNSGASGGGIGGSGGQNSDNARGGGGGLGGDGGNASLGFPGGGGGGGFGGTGVGQIAPTQGFIVAGSSAEGGSGGSNGGGGGGQLAGAAGDASGLGGAGGAAGEGGGGGAGGASSGAGGTGGIGGGGGSNGAGGFGGGGGNNQSGGFGGGGGGASGFGTQGGGGGVGSGGGGGNTFAISGGLGGFGGGGGGGNAGNGGFGGGGGSTGGDRSGGGAAAMGAAIFVVDGGALSVTGAGSVANGTLAAGNGAANGNAFGSGLFLQGNGTLTFNLPGFSYAINDAIADATGFGATGADVGSWGIHAQGGTLVLGGNNYYSGTTSIDAGATLEVNSTTRSAIAINPGGVLGGIGCVASVLNAGMVAPGNATTLLGKLCTPIYGEVAGSTLRIAANAAGASASLNVTGGADLHGNLHVDFSGGPAVGTTYTFLTVTGAITGSFSGYDSNMPSVFGQIVYLPHSAQFTVVANDLIFRNGFDSTAFQGACRFGAVTRSQFAALPAQAMDGQTFCIPPITYNTGAGETIYACQSTTSCQSSVPGCLAVLRAQSGALGGSLASGAYSVDTPVQIDPLSAPVTYSGVFGSGSCTMDLTGTAGRIVPVYDAEPDSLNGARIYAMPSDPVNSLTTNLSGCGAIGAFANQFLPYIEAQFTAAIQSAASGPLQRAGVGQTICPN